MPKGFISGFQEVLGDEEDAFRNCFPSFWRSVLVLGIISQFLCGTERNPGKTPSECWSFFKFRAALLVSLS